MNDADNLGLFQAPDGNFFTCIREGCSEYQKTYKDAMDWYACDACRSENPEDFARIYERVLVVRTSTVVTLAYKIVRSQPC